MIGSRSKKTHDFNMMWSALTELAKWQEIAVVSTVALQKEGSGLDPADWLVPFYRQDKFACSPCARVGFLWKHAD